MSTFKQQSHTGFAHARKNNPQQWEMNFNDSSDEKEKSQCPRFYINTKTMVISAWNPKAGVPIGQPEQLVVTDDTLIIKNGAIDLSKMHQGKHTVPVLRSNTFAVFLQQNANGTNSLFVVIDKPANIEETLENHSSIAMAYSK